MRVGIPMENETGLDGDVCLHFGHCAFFLIVDVDDAGGKISGTRVVPNAASHGGGGCVAVDEILRHKVTHVIAGGMGMGAQQKLINNGVSVFGYSGNVRRGLEDLIKGSLGGIDACREHGNDGGCH